MSGKRHPSAEIGHILPQEALTPPGMKYESDPDAVFGGEQNPIVDALAEKMGNNPGSYHWISPFAGEGEGTWGITVSETPSQPEGAVTVSSPFGVSEVKAKEEQIPVAGTVFDVNQPRPTSVETGGSPRDKSRGV
jgi:hypothetical protein